MQHVVSKRAISRERLRKLLLQSTSSYLHISKFMELGKDTWTDKDEDLIELQEQFFKHLGSYDRILSLRRLQSTKTYSWHYELVEIPKSLLFEANNGTFRIMHNSKQFPKPGYCNVIDSSGSIKFQLYFDAGGERKLQIKGLKKPTVSSMQSGFLRP